jgi:putative peptide zinc metalloprotease protein
LERQNRGAFLAKKTHVLSIAPTNAFRAIVFVDQDDRDDLRTTHSVRLRCDHLADRIYDGRILGVARRESDAIPAALSNKFGGTLATVTQADGSEKLESVAYQAEVAFDGDPHLIRTGMRGRARFAIPNRTVLTSFLHWLRRTFRFGL